MNTAYFSGVLILAVAGAAVAADVQIIPKPVSLEVKRGVFELDEITAVLWPAAWPEAEKQAKYLQAALRPATGLELPLHEAGNAVPPKAILLLRAAPEKDPGNEGYRLTVTENAVRIEASSAAGLFYGIQTLRQLLPPEILEAGKADGVDWKMPCVEIADAPRFAWRGMMLDVSRHFMPKEFVLKCIDTIALHKMNSLQLHLTDDQGWRIEIKKYPKLTEVGAWREETLIGHLRDKPHQYDGKRHGGFYTQEDIREIVAYAADRFVNIVPEIEMPGHAQAAIAAYPELGNVGEKLPVRTFWGVNENIFNAREETILFLQDVLTEVLELFPGPFIHIGGDEARKTQWEASPEVQAKIKALGLKDEHELQSWFIRRMDTFLTEKGRRLIGWDEILEGGLAEGAAVMSWRGIKGGIAAAKAGHDVVMAPTTHTYFDYYQAAPESEPLAIGGNLPIDRVYSFDPIPKQLSRKEAEHILGAQAQLWTEYIATPEHLEYMAWPRMCALAEIAWTPQEARKFKDFEKRLKHHVDRLGAMDVNYRKRED
jgi:hexosaminidase